ncbi:MAG: thiamine phosphate synthase [Pyrinomonadaceae bacterium]
MKLDLNKPLIYLITPGDAVIGNFDSKRRQILDVVRLAVKIGVPLIQIREKQLSAKALYSLTKDVVSLARGTRTRIFVNDRSDIAVAAGAYGVHLTSSSIPVNIVRKNFSKDLMVGISTHTIDEIRTAADEGADFAVFGPIFATPGKDALVGLDLLSEACRENEKLPVFGLGGIDRTNYAEVLAAGAAGFAAIRCLNQPEELRRIAEEINER